MEQEKLNEILLSHKKWLNAEEGGKCADLRQANLSCVNLEGVDLSYANLNEADLSNANLQRANMTGTKLVRANLSSATLISTNLKDADLREANLGYANMISANLEGSNLREVALRYTILKRANLKGANIDFSCIELWCGGLNFEIDEKQAKQLVYHVVNLMQYSGLDVNKIFNKKTFKWLESSHLITKHDLPKLQYKEEIE